jgi:transcriptional/translational regulatory protein YebC/TACO1
MGGADLAGNPTLSDAVQKAKKTSVPTTTSTARSSAARAHGESVDYQTIMYEGYGPNGVALLIECLTDNKNRAAAEVRTAMTRNGGTMARSWQRLVQLRHGRASSSSPGEGTRPEDDVMLAVLEAGAEEVEPHAQGFDSRHRGPPTSWPSAPRCKPPAIDYESADVEFVPSLKGGGRRRHRPQGVRLIDAGSEDSDDVQNVYSNFDLTADVQAELEAEEE